MHELQAVTALFRKAVEVMNREGGERVTKLSIRLGALSHLSEDHLREHFSHVAAGSALERAELEISVGADPNKAGAQEIELVSLEME